MEAIRTARSPEATGSPSQGIGNGDRVPSAEGDPVRPGTDGVSANTEVQNASTPESTPVREATTDPLEYTVTPAGFVTEGNTSENRTKVGAVV